MSFVLLTVCCLLAHAVGGPSKGQLAWKNFVSRSVVLTPQAVGEARVDTSSWVGAEYQPSQSANEDWLYHYQDYRDSIARELAQVKRVMGFTALRVFLHSMIYDALGAKLFDNMDDFLQLAAANGMRVGFVFFDDCWHHAGFNLSQPCQPVKGVHNGCWMASPQDVDRTDVNRFKSYVVDTVTRFGKDARVLWWEIFNEPKNEDFSNNLRRTAYGWAKAVNPTQPIMSCWDENEGTDLVDHHQYTQPWGGTSNEVFANSTGRMQGGIVTEAGARWYQGEASDSGSPLTVIDWLTKLRANKQANFVPGVMIDWEVMVSNSNTRWHWGTAPQSPEPAIPWHQHVYPDGTPVSYTEAGAIRRYITGRDDFVFYEDFLSQNNPDSAEVYLNVPANGYRPSVSFADGLIEFTFWQAPVIPPGSCSGTNTDFVGADVLEVQYSGSTDAEKDASCCQECMKNARCEYWVRATDSTNCWLKSGFQGYSPNPARRGSFRPTCQAISTDFVGSDVVKVQYSGSTEAEKDNSCCQECSKNTQCEYWVRATDTTDCWLKNGFKGYTYDPARRGNFRVQQDPSPSPLELSFSNLTVRVDFTAQQLLLIKANATVAQADLRRLDCGVVSSGWNMFRVLKKQNQIAVWLNPMHDEVFPSGVPVPGGPVKPIRAMPPRLNYTDPVGLGPTTSLALAFVGRIDYFSVLPPVLFGESSF